MSKLPRRAGLPASLCLSPSDSLASLCVCADKGGDPDRVRDSQRWRFADVSLVDEVIRLDEKWRQREYYKVCI